MRRMQPRLLGPTAQGGQNTGSDQVQALGQPTGIRCLAQGDLSRQVPDTPRDSAVLADAHLCCMQSINRLTRTAT